MAKKWIQGAIKRPGSLTAKAKRAGKSVSAFCSGLGDNADTRTKRQCALFHTLRGMSKKKRKLSKAELLDYLEALENAIMEE